MSWKCWSYIHAQKLTIYVREGLLLQKYMLNGCYSYSRLTESPRVSGRPPRLFRSARGATRRVGRLLFYYMDPRGHFGSRFKRYWTSYQGNGFSDTM